MSDPDMDWIDVVNPKRRRTRNETSSSPIATLVKKAKTQLGRVAQKPPKLPTSVPAADTNKSSSSRGPQHQKTKSQKSSQQQNSQQQNSLLQNAQQQNPDGIPPEKMVKPIFVNNSFQVVNNFINGLTLTKLPLLKILSNRKIQVTCFSAADKAKVIEELNVKLLPFHTFTEPADKNVIFLLKGHNHVTPEKLLAKLIEESVPATKVTFFKDNEDNPIYIVHFKKEQSTINFNQLQHSHKSIGNLIVKWEKIDKRRKRPTQCHRCQTWGHSASNCGYSYKCVKCIEDHLPGQCQRKTREGTPKCVNCRGDHAANSRQCEAFRHYEARVSSRVPAPRRHFTSTPAPWNNAAQSQQDFPPLQEIHNFQEVSFTQQQSSSNVRPSRSNNPKPSSLANTHARFMSIPEIDVTLNLFNSLVEELSATSLQHERLQIMMRYCLPSSTNNAP